MVDSEPNLATRRYLLIATSGVTAVGALGASVPFARSWTPSAKAKALGAPITVDIAKLQLGEILGPLPIWRGKPVFVIYRTPEAIERIEEGLPNLADPLSKRSIQPSYAKNPTRSIRPEIGVFVGLCTHLACIPKYYGKVKPERHDANWKGGFYCICHGSKFDLAGRVQKNVPAPTNLEVPPHQYKAEHILHIGDDSGIT